MLIFFCICLGWTRNDCETIWLGTREGGQRTTIGKSDGTTPPVSIQVASGQANVDKSVKGSAIEKGREAERDFLEGKKMLDANCSDCYGHTRDGLAKGIELVEKAVAGGYSNKVVALALLRDAYSFMAYGYAQQGSDEQKRWKDKITIVISQLLDLDKSNPEWLLAKALETSDPSLLASKVEEILNAHPNYSDAQFVMGNILRDQGKVAEAIKRYEAAYRLAKGLQAMSYGQTLVIMLRAHGDSKRADQIEAELRAKY
jgi:tetratricopeptide (TPR) repeat protein